MPVDINILHMRTIHENHIMYVSWDMEHDRHNFFSFWTIFLPFYPQQLRKSKFWENEKKASKHYFTEVYHKWQSYDVWFLRHEAWQTECLVILGHFLPFYLPNSLKNQNEKRWKKHLEISSFYNSVPKIMIICYTVTEIWCVTGAIVIFNFGLSFALLPP